MMSSSRGKCCMPESWGKKEKKKGWHQCCLEFELTCRINSPEVNALGYILHLVPPPGTGGYGRAKAAIVER